MERHYAFLRKRVQHARNYTWNHAAAPAPALAQAAAYRIAQDGLLLRNRASAQLNCLNPPAVHVPRWLAIFASALRNASGRLLTRRTPYIARFTPCVAEPANPINAIFCCQFSGEKVAAARDGLKQTPRIRRSMHHRAPARAPEKPDTIAS